MIHKSYIDIFLFSLLCFIDVARQNLSCFTTYSYRLFIVKRLDKYLVSFYKLCLRH